MLDWELSRLGPPLVDFAYHCMSRPVTPDEFRGLGGYDLEKLGIPSEAEHVAAYCRRVGRSAIEHWDDYLVFNMFRMTAILQGILARYGRGSAAGSDAEETGRPCSSHGRSRLARGRGDGVIAMSNPESTSS